MFLRTQTFRDRARFNPIVSMAVLVVLRLSAPTHAQAPTDTGGRLAGLVHAEQLALEANDPAQILPSAKQLAAVALQLLGTLYAGQDQCPLASEAYRRSLAVVGDSISPQDRLQLNVSLLTSELCGKNEEKAAEVGRGILALVGNTAQIQLLLANAHHTAGDLPGTIDALNQAVALDPNSGAAHLALGNAYWELNEYQYNGDSMREFTLAQKQLPNDFNANENLGSVLSQYERYDDAAPYLRRAAAEDLESPSPWLQMGMNAYRQGRQEEARTALQKAVALTGSNESLNGFQIRTVYAALSRLAAEGGNAAEAQEYAQREQKLHSAIRGSDASRPLTESTGAVRIESASANFGEGKNPASDRGTQVQLVRQLNEIVAKSLNDAGTVLARNHDYVSAQPFFQIASTADPNLEPVMRNLGLAAFHAGDLRTAIEALSHALQQRPDDALVEDDLARARTMLSGQSAAH